MEQHVGRLLKQKGNGQKKFSEGIICKIAEVLAGKKIAVRYLEIKYWKL